MFDKSTPLKRFIYSTYNKAKVDYLADNEISPVIVRKDEQGKTIYIYNRTAELTELLNGYGEEKL